jgi:tellurite resistance protein TerC
MKMSKAISLSFLWITLALVFNAGVYHYQGPEKGLQFLTGYLIELSLSADNVFVFLLIFNYFKVSAAQQLKILFWGILGAQVMRGVFIFAGIALINKFIWITYIFGLFLLVTGIKLFFEKDKDIHPENNFILKLCKTHCPGLSQFAIVLIVIETTDLVFAVDSIPAVLAITTDPFIVYTSNIFAILGLRALYFVLAGAMPLFTYLHYGLGAVLAFVGGTMLIERHVHIPLLVTLGFIGLCLGVSIGVSLIKNYQKKLI